MAVSRGHAEPRSRRGLQFRFSRARSVGTGPRCTASLPPPSTAASAPKLVGNSPLSRLVVVLALASAGLIAGCGGREVPPAVKHLAPGEGRPTAAELEGTWEAEFSEAELVGKGGTLPGRWVLRLKGGRYEIASPDGDLRRGTIGWSPDYVTLANDSRCRTEDRAAAGPGTYRWTADGERLTFALAGLTEACNARGPALTVKPWSRIGREIYFGKSPQADPEVPIQPGEGTAVPEELAGSYTASFSPADVIGKGATPTGRWGLTLRGTTYEINSPDGNVTSGEAYWLENRVTFQKDVDCTEFDIARAGPGTYFWEAAAGTVTFRYTGAREACDPRGPALTTKPWAPR